MRLTGGRSWDLEDHPKVMVLAQAAMTKYRRPGGQNHRHASHGSGGWKHEIKVPADLGPGEISPPGLQTMAFSLRPLPLLMRALIPSRGPQPLNFT